MRYLSLLTATLLMACTTPQTPENTPGNAMSLAGSEWGIGDNWDAFVAFKGDGSVIGNGGCNSFRGDYAQDGSNVSIGSLASTKKLCPPDIMAVENQLLGYLAETVSVDDTHLKLVLKDEAGDTIATLQRRDWD